MVRESACEGRLSFSFVYALPLSGNLTCGPVVSDIFLRKGTAAGRATRSAPLIARSGNGILPQIEDLGIPFPPRGYFLVFTSSFRCASPARKICPDNEAAKGFDIREKKSQTSKSELWTTFNNQKSTDSPKSGRRR